MPACILVLWHFISIWMRPGTCHSHVLVKSYELFRPKTYLRFHSHWIQCVDSEPQGTMETFGLEGLLRSVLLKCHVTFDFVALNLNQTTFFNHSQWLMNTSNTSGRLQTRIYPGSKNSGYTSLFCVPQCPYYVTLPRGLTWARVVFSCVWGCVRGGGGGQPLVWTHVILAKRWAGLSRLLVCQVQWGTFLGRRQWSSWPCCGVDLQPGLGFVLYNLSVVSSCHPALVQSFVILADSGDLQLVWDVVALDLHSLLE